MIKTYVQGGCRAEYDTEAGTYTRYEPDGVTVAETRPAGPAELRTVDPEYDDRRIAALNDAVNQLVLDALMGGM